MKIINHITDAALAQDHAKNFAMVLSELQTYKDGFVAKFAQDKYPLASADSKVINRYLRELGNIPISYYFTLEVYECLLKNIDYIFEKKGSLNGAVKFIECISLGVCEIDGSKLLVRPEYYILDDFTNGRILINEDDDAVTSDTIGGYPDEYLYLFDEVTSSVSNGLSITVWTRFKDDPEFERYLRFMIPRMFPAITDRTIITLIINYPL